MDLTTTYMGLSLRGPLIAGASPLSAELDVARQLEAAGASAIVMHSLFEEQITRDELSLFHHTTAHEDSYAEATSYFPEPEAFKLGPDAYLEQLSRLKDAVDIPVIASLNGITLGGWVDYAAKMQRAGADGLELNVYYLPTDPEETPGAVEQRYLDILHAVCAEIDIPVAMKLSPFFSSPVHMARRLDANGARGLVLFNHFYQPDIDIDTLSVTPALQLTDSTTLRLRLRWLAAVFGHVQCTLAASGGVHTARDAIKALMAGASAVQMASAILKHGPAQVKTIRDGMLEWMEEHDYESVSQLIGSMSLQRSPNPTAFVRANYMKVLQSWEMGPSAPPAAEVLLAKNHR